jgi:excisionase family DNA binding protein
MSDAERYVDVKQLADLMGVSVPTIRRMKKAGMPHERWGLRALRFKPSECMDWARGQGS